MTQQFVPGRGEALSESQSERDRLVIGHVEVVKSLAYRLSRRLPPSVETSDLIGIGMLGLIDAAGRYEASTGVPFDAFARRRVMGAMLDELRSLDWAPRSLRRSSRDLESTIGRLRQQTGREPTEAEIAQEMGLSEEKYAQVLDQIRGLELGLARELDSNDERGEPLISLTVGQEDRPDAQLERAEMRRILAGAIMELPDRERHILALYYKEELTMAEVGAVIGVCESRVSQLRSLAVSRLRVSMREALSRGAEEKEIA